MPCGNHSSQLIEPHAILTQLSFLLNPVHTALNPLHDMFCIARPNWRFRHRVVHPQPGHRADSLTGLIHSINLRISIHTSYTDSHRWGRVAVESVDGGCLALKDERNVGYSRVTARDMVRN